MMVYRIRIKKNGSFSIKAILGLVVYIAMIPVITQLLTSVSSSLTGETATLVSAIVSILPLMLVVKVLDKVF